MQMNSTIVVNFYGGPCSGKTTTAMELTVELKKQGVDAEYVPEYAKELVRRDMLDVLQNQAAVTREQISRIRCLLGTCDVIVTDSPILLGSVYAVGKAVPDSFDDELNLEYKSMSNIDVFVIRNKHYDVRGRLETAEQARKIDRDVLELLTSRDIKFTYHHAGGSIHTLIELTKTKLKDNCK